MVFEFKLPPTVVVILFFFANFETCKIFSRFFRVRVIFTKQFEKSDHYRHEV